MRWFLRNLWDLTYIWSKIGWWCPRSLSNCWCCDSLRCLIRLLVLRANFGILLKKLWFSSSLVTRRHTTVKCIWSCFTKWCCWISFAIKADLLSLRLWEILLGGWLWFSWYLQYIRAFIWLKNKTFWLLSFSILPMMRVIQDVQIIRNS